MDIGEVGEQLRRSTVQVRSTGSRRQGAGSGVVWSSDGTIVTNTHVAEPGEYNVELADAIAAAGSDSLRLRFLRGDRTRKRQVTVSFAEARGWPLDKSLD